MPSTTSLITKLQTDFPLFLFATGDAFHWAPHEKTVYYPADSSDIASLLHELSHAILDHQQFTRDIQLVEYEQAAWHHAVEVLSPRYHIAIDSEQVETSLDTYRDWLHARSRCPQCDATGLQTKQHIYSCLSCHAKWHVNDARVCELRRTIII